MSLNSVTLTGRLGRDPELRYSQASKAWTTFALAVDDGFGERRQTYWIDCKAFDKTAESLCNYTAKGSRIGVSGKLTIETWEDKQSGQKRSKAVVVVNSMELLDSKKDQQDGEPRGKTSRQLHDEMGVSPNEDIPF